MAVLRVATCQFPVARDVRANLRYVARQMTLAKRRGAHVAHFPEGALSGYAGSDFESFTGFDWARLDAAMTEVLRLAAELGIWVVVGSAHRLSGHHKPHNSLYIVNDRGNILDRYDKRFCGGSDLDHYSPGDHFTVWAIEGVTCGALICYDYRYPELYREYKQLGVAVMFHSFHAAHVPPKQLQAMQQALGREYAHLNAAPTYTYPGITMGAVMTAEAACNHLWISCPNSSARESCWPSFFVRADGVTIGRLPRNRAGVLVSVMDTELPVYDSTRRWRERAMRGVYHSGRLVKDHRSEDRISL
jgi:predicted amidohydrolase